MSLLCEVYSIYEIFGCTSKLHRRIQQCYPVDPVDLLHGIWICSSTTLPHMPAGTAFSPFITCRKGVTTSFSHPIGSHSSLHAGRGRRVRRMTPGKPGSWTASPAMSSKAGMGSQGTDDDDVWIPDTGQQQKASLVSQRAQSGSQQRSRKPRGGESQQTEQETPASAWDYPRQPAQSQTRPEVVDLTED